MAELGIEAPRSLAERVKSANESVDKIETKYGKGSIFNMSERKVVPWPARPSGILTVDKDVLGIGGLPKGRIIEIYGPEGGGKTTFCLQTIAEVQEAGELAAYVDAENAIDPKWAAKLGVNMKHLWLSQPDNGEQALEIVELLLRSYAYGIVVVDSVAALVPKSELEGDFGDAQMGLQARMMSQAMRKLSGLVKESNASLIFINQVRDKIGVSYGSPETTTGGRALKFFASLRLDIRRIGAIKSGDEVIGNKVRVKAAKNKLFPPFREAEVDLLFDRGFDKVGAIVDSAVEAGVITKGGAWYTYNEQKFQGKDAIVNLLKDDKELKGKVLKQLKEKTA